LLSRRRGEEVNVLGGQEVEVSYIVSLYLGVVLGSSEIEVLLGRKLEVRVLGS
jgi:hypothetical protein